MSGAATSSSAWLALIAAGVVIALLSALVMTRPLWRSRGDGPSSKGLAAALTVFVAAITVAGYAWLGTPQALDPALRNAAAPVEAASPHAAITPDQIESMVQLLETRVTERPEDAEGWAMLGRARTLLERHVQAVPAFKRAMELRPDDANLIADYADALAMANGRTLEGEPARLVERALKVDPDNLKALSLAGTIAFNGGDYARAITLWQRMAALAGPGDGAAQIQAGIDEARQRMAAGPTARPALQATAAAAPGVPGVAPPPSGSGAGPAAASASAPASTTLRGTVTLDPALAARARPDDTLFVFARAAEGPRMPLAILRKQVRDLPLEFVLDDSSAMSPATRLSGSSSVVVSARISRAGEAKSQPGDLQGTSAAVAPGTAGLKIVIREVVGP